MTSWTELFRVFGRIGVLSFGGPAAQIALMQKELVDERGWLTQDQFLRSLSFCMLLPGPEAMQLATYAGWRLRGIWGGILAGTLFVLPGALVISALVLIYASHGTVPLVQAGFLGIKSAVVIIVIQALRRIAQKSLNDIFSYCVAGLALIGIFLFGLPFPIIVILAAAIGMTRGATPPVRKDDAIATRATRHHWRTVVVWLGLWLVPLVTLSLFGADFLASIGWFFAKLAVVTFGGAYAVLAYMTQTVVTDHGWLSTGQMLDALGLAETTPGPLVLVTQFVAMLAGHSAGGIQIALAAGAVALWATFIPCFLWIFATAPYLEHLLGQPRLQSALQGISASITGVMASLSLWFALHLLFNHVEIRQFGALSFPMPETGSLNVSALFLICLTPLVTMLAKGRIPLVLLVMACLGVVAHYAF